MFYQTDLCAPLPRFYPLDAYLDGDGACYKGVFFFCNLTLFYFIIMFTGKKNFSGRDKNVSLRRRPSTIDHWGFHGRSRPLSFSTGWRRPTMKTQFSALPANYSYLIKKGIKDLFLIKLMEKNLFWSNSLIHVHRLNNFFKYIFGHFLRLRFVGVIFRSSSNVYVCRCEFFLVIF